VPTKAQWGTLLFTFVYFALALACLRQRTTPDPWTHVDIFAGGSLGLTILSTLYELGVGLPALRSTAALREAMGVAYDPGTLVVLVPLSTVDLLVFLDYGHWHLTPALQSAVLQSAGLLLSIIALAWLSWTDTLLTRHFAGVSSARILLAGPFRFVRHPRYAGVLAVRLAFALVFASAVGWALAIVWTIVLLRRIRLEERYLQQRFGREYEAYATHTPRLVPGVY